jgi:putative PIN family toxin of toxin-antitoxin system
MEIAQVVMDTNVLIAALRSKYGASFKLLSLVDSNHFQINLSVPLILEYEDVVKRKSQQEVLQSEDIDNILDFLCRVANLHNIFFLWRPYLKDFKDEFVLELAITAGCDFIITYNKKDFKGVEKFGIKVLTPKEFLEERGLL